MWLQRLAFLMILSLTGCGGGEGAGDNLPTTPPPSGTTNKVQLQLQINGNGTIQTDSGQNCRISCSLELSNTTSVQLQAISDSQNVFVGWQGACSGISSCTIAINSNTPVISVYAEFVPVAPPAKLTLSTGIGGSITSASLGSACVGTCDYSYPAGTVLTLQAQPETNYEFKSWDGACSGSSTCQLTVQQDTRLSATFVRKTANVQIQILGKGAVTSPLLASDCRNTCNLVAPSGQSTELRATADNGYEFERWSNECGESLICAGTFTSNQTITATFKEQVIQTQAENFIVVTNPSEQALLNYPLQFGRPFLAGEISQYPQLVLNGMTLVTQADVKQRHADDSVKHAILSAVIPKIEAGASLKIYFNNQETGRNSLKLSKAQMLESRFNFDATIKATFATSGLHQVSARTMLEQDKFSYWLEGDVATTILVVDHSAERTFDFGSDVHRSVRPAFYATFWPSIGVVQVRFIAEVTNTESIQDQSYDLILSTGFINPQIRHQKAGVPHQAMTRWTKLFWLGHSPLPISIDHNLAYLAKARVTPNFDTSLKIPESTIASEYALWLSSKSDLFEPGRWQTRMATGGGRPEIGIYPAWTIQWLYSGDWRLAEIALRQSELSGAWPMHVREGDPARTFDIERQVSGLGRILSINQGGRPMAWIPRINWHEISNADKINPLKPLISTEWIPDIAHHPDHSSIQYLLTGDFFYLEQLLFLAAHTTMDNNAAGTKTTLGRGPTGSEGALYFSEIRSQAWNLRTRLHTVDVTPDTMPEQIYFKKLTHNAIALWDGFYNRTKSVYSGDALWTFGREIVAKHSFSHTNGEPSPLGFWLKDVSRPSDYIDRQIDYSKAAAFNSGFMTNFMIIALGRAVEMGYPANELLQYVGQVITEPAKLTGYPLELLSAYQIPSIRRSDTQWFDNWQDVKNSFYPQYVTDTVNLYQQEQNPDLQHGYNLIVLSASSFLTKNPDGKNVYNYYSTKIRSFPTLNSNPKWILKPR